jgi:hypothetical protein
MIYDDLMNAGSLPSHAGSPSSPQDHERSGRLVSRSSYESQPREEKTQNYKIVIRGGAVTYAALPSA